MSRTVGTQNRRQRTDLDSLRARFSSLTSGTVYLDGPGGTQLPDSVIEAIAAYLKEDNANVDGPFKESRHTTGLVDQARRSAARLLGGSAEEVGFGLNMTSLNFHLSRTAGRELAMGDEILVTALDHDANISPWIELARDQGVVVRMAEISDDTSLDMGDLERKISPRTRIVAFPWASNAVGTAVDVQRIVKLAHDAGALAWIDATHYAPHGQIDVAALDADVLLCSPYKFFAPHLGLFYAKQELLERWSPYKIRPASDTPAAHRHETGTLPHESLAGFVAAIEYLTAIEWDAVEGHEKDLGERFLTGLPSSYRLHGMPTMNGRVATFAMTLPRRRPHELAQQLADQGIAVWAGHYYAIEVMRRLALPEGALRIGFVHYNSHEEVDRLIDALERLAVQSDE
jgi:cysteine desulfurase family protein (TIGR01976 family)